MTLFNRIKRILAVTVVLSLAILCVACGEVDTSTEGQPTGSSVTLNGPGTTASEPTEPTSAEPTDPVEVDQFINDNFGDYGEEDEYTFKDEVGGKPVTEFGVINGDGEDEIYTPDDPQAPSVHKPDPTEPDPTEPDPTEPDPTEPDPTEPTSTEEPTDPTEPTSTEEPTAPTDPEPTEPVLPKDAYATAVAGIGDYTAEVKFLCEVELTDGSVSRYTYKYRVNRTGDIYSATYKEKGVEKVATFDPNTGVMTVDGAERAATPEDFYRFCSMVEPLPLSIYYYEHSEAGTDVSATMSAETHKALLLNTSSLFTGFDKMEGVEMGKFYFNGHVMGDGKYAGSELAFDMSYVEKSLGQMLFRVTVEVDYVY